MKVVDNICCLDVAPNNLLFNNKLLVLDTKADATIVVTVMVRM
jgi:hypothetical protein